MPSPLLKILFFCVVILVGGLIIYEGYRDKRVVVPKGETVFKTIELEKGGVILEKNSTLNGNIHLNSGLIKLEEGAKINGSIQMNEGQIVADKSTEFLGPITIKNGQIKLGEESRVKESLTLGKGKINASKMTLFEKDLTINSGSLRLEENSKIQGTLVSTNEVEIAKHSSAFLGTVKPPVYRVYDWPLALQYFDILPESHKNQVGFMILTKRKNGLIRQEDIRQGDQYFEGIYDYVDGKLISIDLSNPEVMNRFFKKAKSFFTGLPERRMAFFDMGATTEDFAHDRRFADIYLPAEGSGTLILHEMGHVMDFKEDYSDFHTPKYPWTKEDAVSDYGATHPGEDFAEAYRLYVLHPDQFKTLIEENLERQKKWDYLKEYVFSK